jgi:FAD:protein FMN transferase
MTSPVTRRAFLRFDIAPRRDEDDQWIRVSRTAMACRFEVVLERGEAHAVDAARTALAEADRVEALLTVFREESAVSRVNREAAGAAVAIDAELFAIVQRAAALHDLTDGAFDITSTPLSRCWGFLRRSGRLPDEASIARARALVGMSRIVLDPSARTIRFARPGMALSFGAFGKGYALDRMADVLRRRGVDRALIAAGRSSVLAIGGRGRGWPIDIRSRRSAQPRLARVWLRDGALGTSGAGEQYFVENGVRYGHVIDPRTGWPARGVLSATAISASAADADALSTAFLVGGRALAERSAARTADTLVLMTLEGEPESSWRAGHYPGATLAA